MAIRSDSSEKLCHTNFVVKVTLRVESSISNTLSCIDVQTTGISVYSTNNMLSMNGISIGLTSKCLSHKVRRQSHHMK